MEDVLQQVSLLTSQMQTTNMSDRLLKDCEAKLAIIGDQVDFLDFVGAILVHPHLRRQKFLVFWAVREFGRRTKKGLALISPEQAMRAMEMLFGVLAGDTTNLEEFKSMAIFLETFVVLYMKVFTIDKNTWIKVGEKLSGKNFYTFLSVFPNVLTDKSIVVDDRQREAFSEHFLGEVLPVFLGSDFLERTLAAQDQVPTAIEIFAFYNNSLLYLSDTKGKVERGVSLKLLGLLTADPIIRFSMEQTFNISLSNDAYDLLMQTLRTILALEGALDRLVPMWDQYISEVCSKLIEKPDKKGDIEVDLVLKLISKVIQNFPNGLQNGEKAIFVLLHFLDKNSDAAIPVLNGFKQFLKKICQSDSGLAVGPFINSLWRKLPSLMELSSSEFKENEALLRGDKDDSDEEESEMDFLYVRRTARSLVKYFVYFLDSTDFLASLLAAVSEPAQAELSTRQTEALSYYFASLFKLIRPKNFDSEELANVKRSEKIRRQLQNPAVFEALRSIYAALFSSFHNCKSVQVQINLLYVAAGSLPVLAQTGPFLPPNFFATIDGLLTDPKTSRREKLDKNLQKTFESYFTVIDAATMNRDAEAITRLFFSRDISPAALNQLVVKICELYGPEKVVALTKKLTDEVVHTFLPSKQARFILDTSRRLKSIVTTCSEAVLAEIVGPIFHCLAATLDTYYADDELSEKICQLVFPLLHRVAKSSFVESFLASPDFNLYVTKVFRSFELSFIPSYIYIIETLTTCFYEPKYDRIFRDFFEKITTAVVQLVKPEAWEGGFIVQNGKKTKIHSHFSFLFDQNGLQISDILDDFFGYFLKILKKNQMMFLESPQRLQVARMVLNTLNHHFIFDLKMLLPLLEALVPASVVFKPTAEAAFWETFWTSAVDQAMELLFGEVLVQKTQRKLIRLISSIVWNDPSQVYTRVAGAVGSLPATLLTETEKAEFLVLVAADLSVADSATKKLVRDFTEKIGARMSLSRK